MAANLYNLEKLNIKIRQRKYISLDMQLTFPVKTNFFLPPLPKTLCILMITYSIPPQKTFLM